MVDAVTAEDQDEAEARAFARWLGAKPSSLPRPPAPSPVLSTPRRSEPVIGLFPDAERPR
jgi:hypothetical protein